jgi:hypothetical protein
LPYLIIDCQKKEKKNMATTFNRLLLPSDQWISIVWYMQAAGDTGRMTHLVLPDYFIS